MKGVGMKSIDIANYIIGRWGETAVSPLLC